MFPNPPPPEPDPVRPNPEALYAPPPELPEEPHESPPARRPAGPIAPPWFYGFLAVVAQAVFFIGLLILAVGVLWFLTVLLTTESPVQGSQPILPAARGAQLAFAFALMLQGLSVSCGAALVLLLVDVAHSLRSLRDIDLDATRVARGVQVIARGLQRTPHDPSRHPPK